MVCIDRLGAALCRVAGRELPSPYRYDEKGQLRVIVKPVTWAGITDEAFNEIRQYGRGSASVTIRLLDTIALIASRLTGEEAQAALLRQATMIERGSCEGLPEEQDREEVRERYRLVLRMLEEGVTGPRAGRGKAG